MKIGRIAGCHLADRGDAVALELEVTAVEVAGVDERSSLASAAAGIFLVEQPTLPFHEAVKIRPAPL